MSLDATNWAWKTRQKKTPGGASKPLKKLVLLALGDRAGEDHSCWPSMERLERDTEMDRKTILKIIAELQNDGLIADTGERKGPTKRVKVYQLKGITGREETVPKMEQSQKRNHSKSGTLNSPKFGTQNLPIESFNESKNKKGWFCWKKLESELTYLQDPTMIDEIKNASWFEREKTAFENFNAETNLSDDMMIYHFADKLVQALAKYRALSKPVQNQKSSSEKPTTAKLSEKQIFMFAQKISRLPEYAGKHGQVGESYEDLAVRIADKLQDTQGFKILMPYLTQVGYRQSGRGV